MKGNKTWQLEMQILREILIDCGLIEEIKWRLPCFVSGDTNIVIIQPFKSYFALMFFQGALLKDPKKILVAPGTSQATRQIRFTKAKEIEKFKSTIKSYVKEAIQVAKSGQKVELKKTKDYTVAQEFQKHLDKNKKLKKAFDSLTPGRQRGYLIYFSAAKQSATREARVEKSIPRILSGKGLMDDN